MNTWVEVNQTSDFSIHNIPFGIFSKKGNAPRIGSRIGDNVIDLSQWYSLGIFDEIGLSNNPFIAAVLNDFIALGKSVTSKVRSIIIEKLCDTSLKAKLLPTLISDKEVTMHLPVRVGDYTDFYSSIEHATNVGKMFRDPENALLPNWKHIPVGYHGRASSIVLSGTDIHRPMGQTKPADGPPIYGPSQRMDLELEMAFIIGKDSELGDRISTKAASDYIFGMVLFNDWSARDIQKWEYVPLGPFLGKNFASSVSPWVVTMDALSILKVDGPKQDPPVLPYLEYEGQHNYDINLKVSLTPSGGDEQTICRSNYKYMYWNMAQQLAHHTVNGCNVKIGDMMASGTISGKTEDSYGSMLELAWAGSKPLTLNDGSQRKFIADNDTITMYGYGERDGKRVGFGEVKGTLLPAK